MDANKSNKQMEFMSTHPSDANRITKLKEFQPEAMKYLRNDFLKINF